MERLLLGVLVGIPVVWHLGLTGVAYYDAGRVGLEPPKKWAALTFFVPVIGFFIYLFERSELSYDPETDPYRGNNVNIHPSRADDTTLPSRGDNRLSADDLEDDNESSQNGK